MKKQNKLILAISLALIALIVVLLFIFPKLQNKTPTTPPTTPTPNTVTRIIDGDTFELASGEIVRLICVDTPEKGKKGSEEATTFLEDLILDKEVSLVSDIDDKDAYGRLLRYVYLNDTFVNKEIVSQGFGSVFRYGNDTAKCDEIEK